MKKGAIFDMDGLMFDTETLWQRGWRMLAEKNGFTPSPDFGRDISGTSGEVMKGVVEKYYPGVDAENFIREERAYVTACLEEDVPVKPGLYVILEMFSKYGLKMAVASSSRTDMIRRNLEKTDTLKYFDVVLSSTEVAQPKPAPDVFLVAAEKLGLSANDCYVFEDSFGGVRAGAAAGAATIMIPDQLQPTDEMRELADGIYTDLRVCAEAIERGEV